MKIVYLVYKQTSYMDWLVVKIFDTEDKAKLFCDEQNEINKPEFDDDGFTPDGGPYHHYYEMELE